VPPSAVAFAEEVQQGIEVVAIGARFDQVRLTSASQFRESCVTPARGRGEPRTHASVACIDQDLLTCLGILQAH
jgi:hypothetical protein